MKTRGVWGLAAWLVLLPSRNYRMLYEVLQVFILPALSLPSSWPALNLSRHEPSWKQEGEEGGEIFNCFKPLFAWVWSRDRLSRQWNLLNILFPGLHCWPPESESLRAASGDLYFLVLLTDCNNIYCSLKFVNIYFSWQVILCKGIKWQGTFRTTLTRWNLPVLCSQAGAGVLSMDSKDLPNSFCYP